MLSRTDLSTLVTQLKFGNEVTTVLFTRNLVRVYFRNVALALSLEYDPKITIEQDR